MQKETDIFYTYTNEKAKMLDFSFQELKEIVEAIIKNDSNEYVTVSSVDVKQNANDPTVIDFSWSLSYKPPNPVQWIFINFDNNIIVPADKEAIVGKIQNGAGATCRKCGLFDEYANVENDNKCLCYRCFQPK